MKIDLNAAKNKSFIWNTAFSDHAYSINNSIDTWLTSLQQPFFWFQKVTVVKKFNLLKLYSNMVLKSRTLQHWKCSIASTNLSSRGLPKSESNLQRSILCVFQGCRWITQILGASWHDTLTVRWCTFAVSSPLGILMSHSGYTAGSNYWHVFRYILFYEL